MISTEEENSSSPWFCNQGINAHQVPKQRLHMLPPISFYSGERWKAGAGSAPNRAKYPLKALWRTGNADPGSRVQIISCPDTHKRLSTSAEGLGLVCDSFCSHRLPPINPTLLSPHGHPLGKEKKDAKLSWAIPRKDF